MKIIQGTLPLNLECHISRDSDKKIYGIYFTNSNDTMSFLIILFGIIFSIMLWFNFSFFVGLIALVAAFILTFFIDNQNESKAKYKYLLTDITTVKIVDKATMLASEKKTIGSLGGASLGGALFGGSGAVVGALASGNKVKKEKDISLGIAFKDKNWVVIEFIINEDLLGSVHNSILMELLEVTAKKQKRPF